MTVPMVDCPPCDGTGCLPAFGGRCGTCSGSGRVTAHKAARLADTAAEFTEDRDDLRQRLLVIEADLAP